jgi:large subunit ribosomal protein L18
MRSVRDRFLLRKERNRRSIKKVSDRPRLCVVVTGRHIYAQVIDDSSSRTIASVSTLESWIYKKKASNANKIMAKMIGTAISERAIKSGVDKVVFDKGGKKYHGIVKEVAESAREGKLDF